MRIKPTSVSVIGWLLIVSAVVRALYLDQDRQNPEVLKSLTTKVPFSTLLMMGCLDVSALFISGVGILRGYNWARYFYTAWVILSYGVIFWLLTVPVTVAIWSNLAFVLFTLFMLYRPYANAYFAGHFPPRI